MPRAIEVYCLGVKDHADEPALRGIVDDFTWIGLAKLGGAIRYFRRHGVTRATMAGKIHKVRLYQPRMWIKHLPDWTGLKAVLSALRAGPQRPPRRHAAGGHRRNLSSARRHVGAGDRLCSRVAGR